MAQVSAADIGVFAICGNLLTPCYTLGDMFVGALPRVGSASGYTQLALKLNSSSMCQAIKFQPQLCEQCLPDQFGVLLTVGGRGKRSLLVLIPRVE